MHYRTEHSWMFIFKERIEIALGLNQLSCTQAFSFEWRGEQFARERSSEWRSSRVFYRVPLADSSQSHIVRNL